MPTWQRRPHKGQPRRKFTKDREYVGRWLVSDHREHHSLLGVTSSAGAKGSQELTGSNDVDMHTVNK
ncbi:hypothetical protein N7530_001618 [Penicillium desertorum]|uniref:Uncharacterized protein n=1 Tax=Penicillium desertorum TaxID=1303715 RepID=A0A9X0BWH2_9EURO|nr:hypothetical protein N7530_001618 [Penicillium desertorum]